MTEANEYLKARRTACETAEALEAALVEVERLSERFAAQRIDLVARWARLSRAEREELVSDAFVPNWPLWERPAQRLVHDHVARELRVGDRIYVENRGS